MRRFLPLALLLALAACRRAEPGAAAATGTAVPVRTAVVHLEALPVLTEAPATIRPAERATIAAKLTGTVASFPAALGEAVAAGEVLLTLNAPEADARLRQAQAQLAEAERNAARQRTLVASGVNPADALRDAEDRLRFAQASVAEAEALLAYATVRAPFAGVITEKNVLPGDLAVPGAPLLVLESTQRLRAEGPVPEKAAAGLKPGDPVGVLLDDAPAPVAGRLEEIAGAADSVSRSVLVKVALPAGSARSGQFARLQVAGGTTAALLVPAGAVNLFGQMERVFVVEQGRAVLRLVKTGRSAGDRVEILSGLNAGEQVVLAPPAALHDGQPVAPQP
jgi:RND family efflux transporter MFP subunit